MKAALLTGLRQIEIQQRRIAKPAIKNQDDVLVKIEMVGVCGSDVHYYATGRIGSQVVEFPFVLGHECSGTVQAVGDAVSRVKVGDRVAIDPAVACYNCDQCREGRHHTCRNLKFLGCPGQLAGSLVEYLVMPQQNCYPANDISLEEAVLCEPFAIGLYAVRNARLAGTENIAILGAGPIGLSCLEAAKSFGVNNCFVTEKIDERIVVADSAGACWVGNPDKQDVVRQILTQKPEGIDVVFECAGQQEALEQAVELLKPGGKLMLIGIPRLQRVSFLIDLIRRKEITIVNVRRQNDCTQRCIELIKDKMVNLDFMVTHRFDFTETQEAFDMVADYRDGVVKAMISFS